jgi:hypothetical protein
MKFSMIGQEKGDLLIQVTAWAGLTVFRNIFFREILGARIIRIKLMWLIWNLIYNKIKMHDN